MLFEHLEKYAVVLVICKRVFLHGHEAANLLVNELVRGFLHQVIRKLGPFASAGEKVLQRVLLVQLLEIREEFV